jgi:hypothetical protein
MRTEDGLKPLGIGALVILVGVVFWMLHFYLIGAGLVLSGLIFWVFTSLLCCKAEECRCRGEEDK